MSINMRVALAALRSAYAEGRAASPVKGLKVMLDAKTSSQFSTIEGGAISQSSGSGRSVSFFSPGESGDPSAGDMVEVWIYLREQYDRALAALGGTPTDAVIEALMETYLRPIKTYTNDWRFARR